MNLNKQIKQILFDADDTLWENNIYYLKATGDFISLVKSAGITQREVEKDFDELELKVVKERGYGSIHFVYILETLYNKYNQRPSNSIQRLYLDNIIREFNRHPLEKPAFFNGVLDTMQILSKSYKLYVLTKGDYLEQSGKIQRAGLLPIIEDFFIPPEKNVDTYNQLLRKMEWNADETCMIGNSPKSDINPALKSGMYAIYIPYSNMWKLDREPIQSANGKFISIKSFTDLLDIL
jgi:putative hydrolase of the HAD superfamily